MDPLQRRMLSPDAVTGTPATPPATTPEPPPATPAPEPARQAFDSLLQRERNDTNAVAWLLYQENHGYRQSNNDLRTQVAQLQTQLPAEGTQLLQPDQVSSWTRYQEFGAPDEIENQRKQLTNLQRSITLRDAAAAHGYKVSVLDTLVGRDGITITVREVEGKNLAFVATGEGQTETPLTEYAASHWVDFAPSLAKEPAVTKFIKQNTTGTTPNSNPVKAELDRRYSSPK